MHILAMLFSYFFAPKSWAVPAYCARLQWSYQHRVPPLYNVHAFSVYRDRSNLQKVRQVRSHWKSCSYHQWGAVSLKYRFLCTSPPIGSLATFNLPNYLFQNHRDVYNAM
ncbi:uncharacterized protein EI90DRAFT_374084 [Cantharellus anzutake]|uniref:uncharacterized protein n=1 Tax=Cantharellus anzutake TaxID=1750568 RepID=UPI001907F3E7|nr:uncharacterized protein EI90DRAFT_417779 [Cantharellus anzutake]XP_038918323.1 uncharacterized protein EI90DRAFT_374084 [Cantharellus anzutake]KAF8314599.1 hypothetical protein EI90DRAFT_417779 [Cantharellus anzutake]KAF8334895.1 hypothetical protein EI90DRAFT_374084 [Cantharellus anzutake]